MPYLTIAEYKEFTGKNIEETKFTELLPKASDVLDHVTSHFYARVDIDNDIYLWRVKQFKKALASQIEYFDELGATTFETINNSPQSFTAGRTSVSNASRFNPSGANESKSLIAEEVHMYLEGTGLLYGGVRSL